MNAPFKPANEAAATFVRRHIGPSPRDIDAMLATVGAKSLTALIGETLPASIHQEAPLDLGERNGELDDPERHGKSRSEARQLRWGPDRASEDEVPDAGAEVVRHDRSQA